MKTAPTIQEDSKLLKKIPAHVGIVIVEDEFSFKDLANIIVWSVALGISYISVYDINGEIKRNGLMLQRNIEESKKEVFTPDQSNYDIQLFSSSQMAQEASSTSSDNHKLPKARVHLLCIEDGHRRIVNMAKCLSHMVASGMLQKEDIVPSKVDNLFQESLQFPDPELCLKFGSTDCLFGYMPWQVRLTEIIPQQGDLRLSGPPSGQGVGSGARTRDRRVPADLRADSQATVLPTPLKV
ncbi:dehydrodolichyl diphosphate synthase complex subunit nus1 [Plakobranchus ocellatus]|uniref:ditrans,polycis-polyprenyl diphosphate synthase [(2E,6E)-farnesyldiphosphate specific] n=1 Tax=Plakobranchus ocellatus TaxID=259542 RepID=A0AAV4C9U4_9GAST|nr:dehydrodolichyl diphosphate synthase complex subunit nus1 [Plakobranchus ocellatus]